MLCQWTKSMHALPVQMGIFPILILAFKANIFVILVTSSKWRCYVNNGFWMNFYCQYQLHLS